MRNAVLARCNGNVSAAAREAGVDRKTFYALLKRERDQQVRNPFHSRSRKVGNEIPNRAQTPASD